MPLMRRRITALEDQVEVLSSLNVGRIWDRMLSEFLGEWERQNRARVEGTELESALQAFMDGLSDAKTADTARQTATVAYNQGRDAGLQSAKDTGAARYVVRSEVLDTNTCRPCSMLDGEVFEIGDPEYYANMPPAQCDGGDRCRGFYIPVRG
jgi:hypothetical protein